jgi:O-acetyl-ADP-ribose deacetylase (regulator of RNase III)
LPAVAEGLGVRTVAFPLIWPDVYGRPRDAAARQVLAVLGGYRGTVESARLVLFDDESRAIAERVWADSQGNATT